MDGAPLCLQMSLIKNIFPQWSCFDLQIHHSTLYGHNILSHFQVQMFSHSANKEFVLLRNHRKQKYNIQTCSESCLRVYELTFLLSLNISLITSIVLDVFLQSNPLCCRVRRVSSALESQASGEDGWPKSWPAWRQSLTKVYKSLVCSVAAISLTSSDTFGSSIFILLIAVASYFSINWTLVNTVYKHGRKGDW